MGLAKPRTLFFARIGVTHIIAGLAFTTFAPQSQVQADIAENQALVVFNSQAAEATALKDAYLAAHPGIPAENVVDLNSDVLVANPADLTYAQFTAEIRDPVRDYLLIPGSPEPQEIVTIVLIRPMPHRIRDGDRPMAGDNPNAAADEFNTGDAGFSSIDAELVLLWHDLDAGEDAGIMDSLSDNLIDNPYHQRSDPIDACADCARDNIQVAKTFDNMGNRLWIVAGDGETMLTPGDMYLVCRIDGTTLADATASIERARNLRINRKAVICFFDEYNVNGGANDLDDDFIFANDPLLAGNDYEEARAALLAAGWMVRYDGGFDFVDCTEETRSIIGFASYGENHDINNQGENPPGAATYIDCYAFPPGAMFNTLESDNGRALNGLGSQFNLEQLADFITAGGTFAVGNVFEPFTLTVADNEFLFVNLLVNGLTWGEAAYTSLPGLSWQQIVVGDPLAKPIILNDLGLPQGDLDGDGEVTGLDIQPFLQIVLTGFDDYYTAHPTLDPVVRADFTGDFQVTLDDLPGFLAALLAP